jgi:hypothetical protein
MASSIDASTSGAGGVITTADNTGILQLKTAGVVAVTVNASSALGVGTSPSFGTSGQVLTSAGSSAAPTWSTISSGGMTLLGTLTTTSGTSQALSGLTLTSYKQLSIFWNNVSWSSGNNMNLNTITIASGTSTAANATFGWAIVDLSLGTFTGGGNDGTASGGTSSTAIGVTYAGNCGVTTATTTLTFSGSASGTFDLGSIKVYGVA